MSAVYQWSESNGAGEAVTDGITNLNFGSADSPNLVVASNRILASENSFEKYIRGKFTGTFTEISNIKFWKSSGAYVAGEDIHGADDVVYATPVVNTSVVATVTIPITEGTALVLQSEEGLAVITQLSGVSGYTKYICLQLQTTVSTPAGSVNQKEFTLQYDEV